MVNIFDTIGIMNMIKLISKVILSWVAFWSP